MDGVTSLCGRRTGPEREPEQRMRSVAAGGPIRRFLLEFAKRQALEELPVNTKEEEER